MRHFSILFILSLLLGCGLGYEQAKTEFRTKLGKAPDEECLAMLKKYPKLITENNAIGESNLQRAVYMGRVPIADYLLENGAPIDPDPDSMAGAGMAKGRSALLISIEKTRGADPASEYRQFALKLIDKGANINLPDPAGWTSLHQEVVNGDVDLCKLLIEKGADTKAEDTEGRRALDMVNYDIIADNTTKKKIIALFAKHGVDYKPLGR